MPKTAVKALRHQGQALLARRYVMHGLCPAFFAIDPMRTQRDPNPALSKEVGIPAVGCDKRNNVRWVKRSKRRGSECSNSGNCGTT